MGRFLGPRHISWLLPYPWWICDSGRAFIGFMGDSDHWQGLETATINTMMVQKKISAFLRHVQLWPVESIQQQGTDDLRFYEQVPQRTIRLSSGSENSDNQGLEGTLKQTLRDVSLGCELWIAVALYFWVRWHIVLVQGICLPTVRSPWTEGCQDHNFVTRWLLYFCSVVPICRLSFVKKKKKTKNKNDNNKNLGVDNAYRYCKD